MMLAAYCEELQKRGLQAIMAENIDEAIIQICGLIDNGSSVGIAGSVSIEQSGIYDELQNKGCTVFWHSKASTPEEGEAARQKALTADTYLCSANGVTKDGKIVNIDGKGNRIASIAYGPKRVIFLIGKNKLVNGGVDEALDYIHSVICPKNAKRLKVDAPCGKGESCDNCASNQRMCNLCLIVDNVPRNRTYIAVLVNQELGH